MKIFNTFILLFCVYTIVAQTGTPIQIIDNNKIVVNSKDSFKYIIGNPAIIKQGTTLFKADSIFISDKIYNQIAEAFGNVYINENDSVITTAGYLKYFTDKRVAQLRNNVTIRSKNNGTFTGNDVDYDMNTKMATYKTGGKIVSKKAVLTSKTGQYYTNTKDALFTGNVFLNTTDDDIVTDSLYYNVNSETANFVTYTKITNKKKGRVVETTRGMYDLKNGIGKFTERTLFKEKDRTIIADIADIDEKAKKYVLRGKGTSIETKERYAKADIIIDIDEANQKYHLEGNAFIEDKEKKEKYRGEIIDLDSKNEMYRIDGNGLYSNEKEGIVITGNKLYGDGKEGKSIATGKPVAIIKQENDSIFIAADTLYSGRLLQGKKIITDSIKGTYTIDTVKSNPKDTLRYFEGFHHVKIFSDSVQAICDSVYYSTVDSVFRLYQNPIVWNDKNQITGDTMYMYTKNKKVSKVDVFEKAFLINTVLENKFYNQIRSSRMIGYFTDGEIDSTYSKGSAEIVFYIQDDDKAYIGVDKSSADIIYAYFQNKEIYKIKWLNKYDAVTTPMKEADHEALKLRGFLILQDKRPKSKLELFF